MLIMLDDDDDDNYDDVDFYIYSNSKFFIDLKYEIFFFCWKMNGTKIEEEEKNGFVVIMNELSYFFFFFWCSNYYRSHTYIIQYLYKPKQ